ncbi:Hypothetical protein A7982_07711 [Minicystis rosea]|nr:Hypothetical protein A7982_07711 [Minicystis rosea]
MKPTTSADFDRAYRQPITFWGDVRIPKEVTELSRRGAPRRVLELGCGVGRFTRYMAKQGLRATGVDFSPVAIEKAKARVAGDESKPDFLVGDVTHLEALRDPFDIAFDVGCFHCLDREGQRGYVAELNRLLVPGGALLIWALDDSPSDLRLSPAVMKATFAPSFDLESAESSRRRLAASHWYWLVRR